MVWSAATETELKMIEWLIPSVKDNPYNAIAKIQELQSSLLNKVNSQRWTLNLPYLDQTTLLDKDKRVQLYYWGYTQWGNQSLISMVANSIWWKWTTNSWGGRWWLSGWWSMSWGWGRS